MKVNWEWRAAKWPRTQDKVNTEAEDSINLEGYDTKHSLRTIFFKLKFSSFKGLRALGFYRLIGLLENQSLVKILDLLEYV